MKRAMYLIRCKILEREPLTTMMNFLRRGADGAHFLEDPNREPGAIYNEYIEVWKCLDNDPTSPHRTRTKQAATGRQYVYVDSVTSELYDKDENVRTETDDMPYIVSPDDFTYHRLRAIPKKR